MAFIDGGLVIYDIRAGSSARPVHNIATPDWSPDTESIIFSFQGDTGFNQIGRYHVGSGAVDVLTPPGQHYFSPDWSPDGRVIVAAGSDVAIYADELFLLEAACLPACAGTAVQLTHSRTSVAQPDWSPDGQSIAFNCFDGSNYEICIIDVASGTVRQVTHTPMGVGNFTPAWRPVPSNKG